MHPFLLFRGLLTFLLGLGSALVAHASHVRGGDISFASVASTTAGVPRYHVVVRQFVEPVTNGLITATVPLVASRSCGATGTNTFTTSAPRTQLLDGTTLSCSSPAPLYQVAIYEVDVDLLAGQWLLSVTINARTFATANLLNSATQNCYLVAYLDNTLASQDASPVVQSLRQPYLNMAAFSPHHLSAFDANGDSLRYEIVPALSDCNQPIAPYPSTFTPHFAITAGTGLLTPIVAGVSVVGNNYNIVVKVSEYRRINGSWQLIGYVIRDTLYFPFPTNNQNPVFTNAQVNGGAMQPINQPIAVQPGQSVAVVLSATDPDISQGQAVRFVVPAASVVPGLSLAPTGSATSTQLTWQVPATLPPGRYAILVTVLDNSCFYNASEERTLTFVVGSTALATRTATAATDVFPVPFREQVQFTTAPNQAVILVDALGREVARLTSTVSGLVRWQPAASLPAGLYLARSAESGQPLARLLRAE